MKYEGMYRELYHIITRESMRERIDLLYQWYYNKNSNLNRIDAKGLYPSIILGHNLSWETQE